MKDRWLTYATVLFVLGLTVALLPGLGGAYHLSMGIQDSVGLGLEETSQAKSVGDDDWIIGTTEDCPEGPTGDVAGAPLEPVDTVSTDGFCGALLYHDDLPDGLPDHWYSDDAFLTDFEDQDFEQKAPRDQSFTRSFFTSNPPEATFTGLEFDVEPASYIGAYNLQAFSLYVDPDEPGFLASDDARYGGGLLVPNAAQLTQQVLAGDMNQRMNGWLVPDVDQTFIAFLEDDDGPISQDRFDTIIDAMIEAQELDGNVIPGVCGFADGFNEEIRRVHSELEDSCPVTFRFVGENSAGNPTSPDAEDPCQGVLYACSQAQNPAWYAEWVCPAAPIQPVMGETGTSSNPHHTTAQYDVAGPGCWEALDSTDEYRVWHFVAAPTPSACGGDQQPTFATSLPNLRRFLAYDLDVFTPPQSGEASDGAGGSLWANAVRGHAQATAEKEVTPVHKSALSEPNYDPSADAWNDGTLVDTSQQDIEIDRDPLPWCNLLDEDAENVADPWVNVIDAMLERRTVENTDSDFPFVDSSPKRPGSILSEPTQDNARDAWLGAEDDANSIGAFGTNAEDHDRSNRPGPAYVMPKGHAAMYFDEDDDGSFGPWTPRGSSARYSPVFQIEEGVYPMQWDTACSGIGSGGWGYGSGTGLVQAIYLPQQTHFVTKSDLSFPTPGSYSVLAQDENDDLLEDNVYVFFSEHLREAYDDPSHPANEAVVELVEHITKPFMDEGADRVFVRETWEAVYHGAYGDDGPLGEEQTIPNPTEDEDVTVTPSETVKPQADPILHPPASDFDGDRCPSDRFENRWSFYHGCQAEDALGSCEGATMVTAYAYHATRADGTFQSAFLSSSSEPFDPEGDGGFDFCSVPDNLGLTQPSDGCLRAWVDVDPIDNDPTRNLEDLSPLRHDPSFA